MCAQVLNIRNSMLVVVNSVLAKKVEHDMIVLPALAIAAIITVEILQKRNGDESIKECSLFHKANCIDAQLRCLTYP